MLANLLCSLIGRRKITLHNVSLWFVHVGLLLLLLGQLVTDMFAIESSMRLTEGERVSYSEDPRRVELAIVETTQPRYDDVVVIPEALLRPGRAMSGPPLPFDVTVRDYWRNSALTDTKEAAKESSATENRDGRFRFQQLATETSEERRNMPTAFIQLASPGGALGTWAVSLWLRTPRMLSVSNRTFEMSLRQVRYYKPFALQLEKFTHDRYPGSQIPRNFASDVRIMNEETGENRPVRIRMNEPLRYRGETFYQSGFDETDPRISILQVVRNPVWVTPYVSCGLVSLGLAARFLAHLISFARRKHA